VATYFGLLADALYVRPNVPIAAAQIRGQQLSDLSGHQRLGEREASRVLLHD
jgi:hypothetical protein